MFGSLQQRLFALRQDVVRLLAKPSKDVASTLDLQFLEERVLYNGVPLNGEPLLSVDPVELDPQQSPENLADPSPAANLGELTPIEGFEELSAIEAGLDGVGALLEQLAALDEALVAESQLGKSSQTEPASETIDASQPSTPPASWELIVIDGGLSDQQTLSSILEEGLADDCFFEVIVLDRLENGVETIAQFLGSSEHQYSAIHLVTHGSAGGLQLGGIWLTHSNLEGYADALQQWGEGLTEQADVLIYGCYVAEGQESQQWLAELAGLLQVDIQASTDLTGSSLRGGDWDLEFTLGQLETNQIFAAEWIDSTNWVLANNAPVLDTAASPTMGLVLEGATNPSGVTVASLVVDGSITDADGSAVEAIAITGLNTSLGSWQYSINGGTNWLTIDANLINNTTNELALLLGPTAQLRLIPFGDVNGSVNDAITFRAWDQTSGSEGQYAVISATGGSSAFSTSSDTAAITVTAVNDAPTFLRGDGKVTTDVGASNDEAYSVTLQPDGRIVVAGFSYNGSNYDFALTRYNADGTLDTSFGGGDGIVTTAIGTGADYASSVTLQPDGKIVIAGSSISTDEEFALVRYNVDGMLDSSFGGGDGIVTTDVGAGYDVAYSVTLQPDGKIVVAGNSYNGSNDDFALTRYNADGSLDTSFGGGGIVTTDIGTSTDSAKSVTVQADGKIVVGGYARIGSNYDFALTRYNADGTLDTSFGGGDGIATTALGAGNDGANSLTLQPDGRIVVAGYSSNGSNYEFALTRYNADGSLDTSFGGGDGIVNTAVGAGFDVAYSVTLQSDGKIVVAGYSYNGSNVDFALTRYNADGSLDTSFGGGDGIVTTAVGADYDYAYSVTLQPDGKIVVAGSSWNGSNDDIALVRYNADGSLDTTFDRAATLGGSVSYIENGSPVVLDSDVRVFDVELSSSNLSGATLTLVRNGGANGQDQFSATGTLGTLTQGGNLTVGGTTIGTVTTNSSGSLVLTFNNSATNTLVNSAMQQIAYANSSEAPPASVQINWTFSDNNSGVQGTGGALTATGNVIVNITAVNDAPVAVNDTFTTTEDTAVTFDVRTNDSDVDSGSLSVTQINGSPISIGGSVAVTGGSVTLNANGTLTFTPTTNYNGSPSFTYTLSDGSLTATATVNGTVTAVQDAPVLDAAASPSMGLVLEGATNPTGVTVASLIVDGSITDADGSAAEAIAITALNASLGAWQYSLDGGTNWLTINAELINSSTNELALLLGPTAQLRLIPFGDVNGSVNDAITFRAWDQTSGSEGQYAVISATGGSSAFSTSSDTADVTVTAVNDAPTFLSGDGIVTTAIGTGFDQGRSVTVQPDGKVLVGGRATIGSTNDFALVRYNADGSLDTSFGTGGMVTTAIGTGSDTIRSVTLQPDGKIVVAGSSISTDEEFALVRYNANGTLDTSFGTGGKVTTALGTSADQGRSVTVQPDGKVVVGGYARIGSTDDFALARYNADGTMDTSFGTGGMVTTAIGTGTDQGNSVTVQPDGKIVVGGYATIGSTDDFALVRYNANGTLDTSFGTGGKVTTAIGTSTDQGYSVTVQPDGKIVVGGYARIGSTDDFALVRYNSDGSLDTTFDRAVTLGGSISYTENGSPVVLDSDVRVFDVELSSSNFSGATLTLVRNGGANGQDQFSATGTLGTLTQGGNLTVGGTTIGTVTTNSSGSLVLTFNNSASNTLVNSAMQQIAYANNTSSGSVQIDWTFSDGNSSAQGTGGALTATGNVTVNITSVNDAPIAVSDSATAVEAGGASNGTPGTNPTGNVLTNDTDPDAGDTKTVIGVSAGVPALAGGPVGEPVAGTYGSINIAADGSYTYTVDNSNANVQALRTTSNTLTDTFTYTMRDTLGLTSTTQITVTIQGANDAPNAVADSMIAVEAGGVSNGTAGTNPTGNVVTNDVDPDSGDTKTVTGVAVGVVGSASGNVGSSVTGSYGTISIAANGGYSYTVNNSNPLVEALRTSSNTLTDVFTYTMQDTSGSSSTAQVTVTIQGANDGPVALADSAIAVEAGGTNNGTAGSNPTGNVLTNDTDVDAGDTKTIAGVAAGIVGSASTNVGSTVSGAYGALIISADGSYEYRVDDSNATVQALRSPTDTLTEVFTYSMRDTAGALSTTQITITIQGSNDAISAVTDTAVAVEAGGASNGTAGSNPTGNVLANDFDVDSVDTQTVTGVMAGTSGMPATGVASNIAGAYGSIQIASDGSYTYTVDNNNAAVQALRTLSDALVDVFTYSVTDSAGLTSTGQISVTINGSNDNPTAVNDIPTIVEAGGINNATGSSTQTGNVLANDTDIDANDTKTVSAVAFGSWSSVLGGVGSIMVSSYGTMTVNADGTFTYWLDNSLEAVEDLRTSSNTLKEVFTYTMQDAAGASSLARITIVITGGNDAPQAVTDTFTATESRGFSNAIPGTDPSGNVLSNDTDIDSNDTQTVVGVASGVVSSANTNVGTSISGSYGAITIAANGSMTYVVDQSNASVQGLRLASDSINDVFSYTMRDAGGLTSTTQVTILITGGNDAPTAVADQTVAVEAGGYGNTTPGVNPTGNLLANDIEPDFGDTISVIGIAFGQIDMISGSLGTNVSGTYGSIVVASNGTYTYTVDNNNATVQALRTSADQLTEIFTYTIQDTFGYVSSAQITVTIQGAKDASTAVADTLNAVEAGGVNNTTGGSNPTGNVLSNDTSIDTGDTLTVTGIAIGNGIPQSGLVGTLITGTYGTFTIQSNGSCAYTIDNNNSIVQSLRTTNDTLSETFTYSMQDNTGLSSSALITVIIHGDNDKIIAVSDSANAVEAGGVNNSTAGLNPTGNVLTNDTDVDAGDTKTVVGVGAGNLVSVLGGVGSATLGQYGSVTIHADGSYTYTVNNNNASVQALRTSANTLNDIFTYQVEDTAEAGATAKLTVVISGANDVPTAISDVVLAQRSGANGFEGISPTGNVVYNDIEPDNGDTTSVTGIISGIVSQATGNVGSAVNGSYGAITLNANGSYTYNVDNDNAAVLALGTPAQWIQDTFTYTISDSSGLTSTTQIYVRIYGAGTNSLDSNTVYATEAGGYGNLTTGLDPSGDFTVDPTDVIIGAAAGSTSITPPENLGRALTGHYGTIIIAADGTYAYTVNNSNSSVQTLRTLSHTVADIFSYTVEDSNSILTEWRLTVAIRGANDAPGAVGDTFTAIEAGGFDNTNPTGTDATGNVLTNDTDVDFGDTQTVIGVAAGVQSSTAGNLDSAVTGNYGSITVSEDGSIVYVVDNDNATVQALRTVSDTIQDVFSYTMRDSAGLNSTAQITILITGSNDSPTAVTDQLYAQEAGGYSNDAAGINPTGNVFANDLDPDSGETKTVVGVIDGTYSQISGNVSIAITGIYGAITIDADGTYVYTVDNNNVNVQYLLASSVPLVDIFTYSMQDTYGEVSTAQITVSIHGSNDAPIAVSDNLVAVEAGGLNNANPGSAPSGNLLSNDHAIDAGDSWSISAIGAGSGPQSAGLVGTSVTGTYGSILVDGNGTYQYTFNNNDPAIQALRTSSDVLVDSFSYTITDGSGLTSITQIYVSITGSNDTPIATSDNIIARESGGLNNGSAGINPTGNVLANDTDVDAGETKTVVGVAAGVLGSVLGGVGNNQVGVYGTLVLSADGSYTYTVDNTNSFVQALRTTSDTLTDIFTYRMHDTAGAASTTQITIVIQGANDAPIAQNNSVTATAAGGASFPNGINPSGNVLSNDSDVDAGDTRTVLGVAAGVVGSASGSVAANVTGSFGSLQINANGSYVYTVDNTNEQVKQLTSSGPRLSDVFTYTMTDAGGLQSTAQITVSIRGANDAPIAGSDTVSAIEAGGVDNATPGSNPTGNVLTNDTDPDSGDTMTVTGVTSGVVSMVNGSVNATVSGTYGTIVVQANGNYTYTVNNSNSAVQSLRTSSDRLDDIFSYTISDFPGRKSTAQITVTIQGVNDALVAVSDSATAIEAGGLNNATAGTNPTGNVLTNDTDVDAGDTKTVAGVAAGVVGSASTDVGSSVIGTYGSIVIAADGNYTYTVDNANSAVQALRTTSNTLTDVFTYTARDTAGALSTTQITVTIQGSNDTPIASNDSAIAGEAGGVANGTAGVNPTGNVLTNDTDIDSGDTKTVAGVASGSVPTGALNAGTSVTGTYGSVVINSDGSYTYTVNNSNAAVQALRTSGETLSEVFTYTMRDTAGATSNTQLSLTITGANDAPVAVTDLIVALEAGGLSNATPGTNPTGNVLTNDTDVDSGDSRTVTGVAAGVVASASTNVGSAVTGTYGTITITANGSLSYTVDNNNAAVQALRTTANTLNDIFTYTIQDTAGLTSTTQVTITIQGANDTPVAVNDTATAVEAGGVANGTAGTNPTGNVLTNDTDIDSAGNGETKTVTGVAAGSVASPTGSVGASVTGTFGSINIASNGTYTYTVDNSNATVQALRLSSQTLSETFTYRMSDAAGATSVATISITIQGSNDAPVAVADVITALEAGGLNNATPGTNPNGNLLTNDTDVDAGDTRTVAGVAAGVVASASTNVGAAVTGSYGTIVIAADGSSSYTVDNNNAAVQALRTTANTINDIFTYTIRDTAGATATTQVTITIQGANDTPIAVTDSATAVEAGGTLNGTAGTSPTGNVVTNDADVDSGDTKTVVGVVAGVVASAATGAGVSVAGTYGSVLINASGAYTYTVDNSNAAVQALRTSSNTLLDVFTYQMQDTAGVSSVTQLSVTIQGSNDAPVAVADSATAVEAGGLNNGSAGTSPNGNVLTNDTDVDAGDTRTVAGVAAGVVASASTNAGASVAGAYGSIIIAADGSYTYTVDNNNSIVQALRTTANTINDVFTYTVRDTGGLTASTQVTITIQGANDAPIATVDTTIAVEAGGIANGTAGTNPSGNVLTNDIDVDAGDTKTVIGVVAGTSGSPVTGAGNVITGDYGTVVINADGSYTYTVNNSNLAIQALRTSSNTLADVFTYQIRDTAGLQRTAQLSITIQGSNDAPIAFFNAATASEAGGIANGTAGTNPTGNVLTNDTDVDSGDTKTVIGVVAGSSGTPVVGVGATINGTYGSVLINADGSYTYTVDNSNAIVQALRTASNTLSDVFTYQIRDTEGLASSTPFFITIQGANDAPSDLLGTLTVAENAANGTSVGTVTRSDVDSGDGASYSLVDNAGGRFAINSSTGGVTVADVTLLNFESAASHTITVRVTDTAGASYDEVMTVTLSDANEAPSASSDSATATEAGGVNNGTAGTNPTGNVLTNDTDVDAGDTLTVTGVAAGTVGSASTNVGSAVAGTYGSINISSTGAYTYTIDNSNATVQSLRTTATTLQDVFSYTMRDTAGLTSTTQVTVTIQGANDNPVGVVDTGTATEASGYSNATAGSNATGNVLSNDTDVDSVTNGETKTVTGVAAGTVSSSVGSVSSVVNGSYGSITINGDGTYSYVVNESNATVQALRLSSQTITDVFSYTVTDAGGLTSTTQITITIQGGNDAPIGVDDTATAVEAGGTANGTAGTNPTGNLLTNDSDFDSVGNGETKTVTSIAAGSVANPLGAVGTVTGTYGSINIAANGAYSYTVDNTNPVVQALRLSGQTLSETFTYRMADAGGLTSLATVTITIQGANDTPTAVVDTAIAVEAGGTANGTAGTNPMGNVLTNDTDVDTGDTKTVKGVVSGAQATATGNVGLAVAGSYGSINIASDGSYIYTVNNSNAAVQALRTAANTLSDLFTYRIVDTGGLTSLATITVTIQGANDAPVGVNDTSTAIEAGGYGNSTIGSNATGNVLSNDTDVDSAANGETWTVSGVASGTVSNTVGNVGTVVTGSYGLIQIAADGTYTYVIDESNATVQALRLSSQTITDIFSYTLSDAGGLTSTSQLTVTIQGANDTPVSNDDTNTAVEAGGLANGTAGVNPTGNVLTNDTDVDSVANGESKTVTGVAAGSQSSATEFVATSVAGLYGSVVINSDGSYTYTVDNSNAAVQALRFSEQTLNDTFTYTMSDTVGLTSKSRLTITIQGANDAPVANDDTNIAVEAGGVANGTSGTNPTGNVLTNDTDIDSPANGETKRVTGVASGAVPSPSGSVGTSVTGIYGSISIAADGSYSYTVDNSNAAVQGLRLNVQTLSETFTYAMADTVGASAVATVTITIQGANDAPHDATGFLIVAEGTDNGVLVGTVEGHDVDDGEVLTYSLVDDAGGRFAIDSSTGEVTVADGSLLDFFLNTTHDIIVRISDLSGANYEKVMTVIVTDVNQGPSANPDAGTAFEAGGTNNGVPGSNATGNVLTNDTDIDIGDTKTVSGVSAGVAPSVAGNVASPVFGAFGSITIAANGNFIYTINNHQLNVESLRTASNTLVDVFTYTIQDRSWETSTTQITITIQGANDTPLAVVDSIVAVEAGGVGNGTAGMNPTGNVLANDTDVDAQDTKTVIGVAVGSVGSTSTGAGASHVGSFGTINIDSSGVYTYTVNNNHAAVQSLRTSSDTLSDVFTYTMQDTAGLTSTTQITVTIQGANDAPHDLVGTLVIAENAMRGEVVGTVTRSDLDSGDGATYSLVDNAGGRFAIDSSTGVITVADYSLLDYEAATSHRIVVRIMDSAGDIYGEAFTVQVTDIDEFDVGSVIDANTEFNGVPENSAIGTTVGIIASASDSDGTTNTVTYSLSNSAGGRFAIDNITGVVTVANSSLLDFEANESHSIGVLASSVDGSVSEATFTIAVLQVNERPVALGERYQTDFASVVQIAAAALLANDYDPEGGPMQVTVMSLPSKGVFQQGDTGVFLFKPESNFTGTVTLVYVVSDGVLTSDPQIVEIVVTQPATTVVAVPEDRPVPNSANANALNPVIGDFRMSGSEEPAVKRAEDVSVKQETSGELSAVTNGSLPDLRTERDRNSKGENYSQSQSDMSKDENIFGDGKLGIGKIEGRSLIDLEKGFVVDSSQLSLTQFIRPEERQELEREEQQFFFQSVTPFAFGTAIGTGISLQILATAQIGGSFLAQSGIFAPLDPLTVLEGSSKVKKSEEREDLMFEAFVKSNGGK